MIPSKRYFLGLSCLVIALFSCTSKQNPPIPTKFERFDKAIFSQRIPQLVKNYPTFTPFYLERIIQVGKPTDSLTANYFQKFKETYQNNAYDSVKLVFHNMENIETKLSKALGNYRAAFPQDSFPKFYTHFSGFNESIVTNGSIISVSLENYLGESSYYAQLGIYKYLRKGMYPDRIPVDILKLLLLEKTATKGATKNLLSTMIYQGKIFYALHKMFPDKDLAFLLNYSEEQAKWCKANESMMWGYIIEQKHLYSSKYREIRSYIDPAPFTKGFPNESPGQTGIWIGYQIVKNYIKNTDTSISELLADTDYQKILQKSTYNPDF